MSKGARPRAASAVRSFYTQRSDALGASPWRLPRRSQLVDPVPGKAPEILSRDQTEALRSAADGYRGLTPECACLAVFLAGRFTGRAGVVMARIFEGRADRCRCG
ncbi:hypothetical protein [Streptomyces sp. NPDC056191]|uniref:hypothetical protein n=1 Tax=Streptomyces sp. NPDC056191 TaxID=3345742 RepID=UPI0035E2377A